MPRCAEQTGRRHGPGKLRRQTEAEVDVPRIVKRLFNRELVPIEAKAGDTKVLFASYSYLGEQPRSTIAGTSRGLRRASFFLKPRPSSITLNENLVRHPKTLRLNGQFAAPQ